jgi:hypothetical protein
MQIGINPLILTPLKTSLIGIVSLGATVKGLLEVPVTIGTYAKCLTL